MSGGVTVQGLTFAPELFRRGFPEGGGPCRCASTCCMSGVYVDIAERDRIMRHTAAIAREMDATQITDPAAWFDDDEHADSDFPSGRCVGTAVINEKCAFLDRQGRCSIQVAAVEAGLDRWAWKPHYCILFPLEVSDGVVNFDDMLQDDESCCTVSRAFDIPLFRACRDEIVHLIGEEGFQELERHYSAIAGEQR